MSMYLYETNPVYATEKQVIKELLLFSHLVVSDSLWPQGLHTRLTSPSPSPGACSNSCPLNRWWHPTISSSVIPFSSCLLSVPASGSFPMSQLFASGGHNIGASASASGLPMNILSIKEWKWVYYKEYFLENVGIMKMCYICIYKY